MLGILEFMNKSPIMKVFERDEPRAYDVEERLEPSAPREIRKF